MENFHDTHTAAEQIGAGKGVGNMSLHTQKWLGQKRVMLFFKANGCRLHVPRVHSIVVG